MTRAKIIGTGMCVPKYVLTNEELSGMVDTSDEWIVERTGIRERHIARDGETCLSLCTAASKQAIARAGIQASEIDMIIVASLTPDRVMPAMACELNAALGCNEPISFDLTAACSGFIFALSVADQFIRTGQKKTILCVGAELLSAYINWEDRATVVLFGDGAGAVVLQASNGPSGIMSTHTYSNGNYGELLCIPASGSKLAPSNPHFSKAAATIQMNGRELFRFAVSSMIKVANEAMEANHVKASDIDLFIPHQANTRILDAVGERLGIPAERTMVNLHKYGNTSAATIPMALHEAIEEGRCKEGDLLLLDAFGGGLTYGSCMLRL